jgi:pSer/pThr/pTyr-binding forkhead associated (FHA) protein
MTIGRQADCDISIPGDEISRHHAKLQVLPDGVMVEDMGSANGTFINDKRVHSGVLKPGEELRLDTVRFLLMSPGMEVAKPAPAPVAAAPEPAAKSNTGLWIGVLVAALAIAAAGATKVLGYW